MYTRKQYMESACTHSQYYRQYATKSRINSVRLQIWLDTILLSTDKNLNDIPLKKWDNIHFSDEPTIRREFAKNWDSFTISSRVCLAKECASIIKEYFAMKDTLSMADQLTILCPY